MIDFHVSTPYCGKFYGSAVRFSNDSSPDYLKHIKLKEYLQLCNLSFDEVAYPNIKVHWFFFKKETEAKEFWETIESLTNENNNIRCRNNDEEQGQPIHKE